jgi:single-stranded DNA-binding protein
VQRTFEVEGSRRTTTEIQVQHLGADVQFATVEPKDGTERKEATEPQKAEGEASEAEARVASSGEHQLSRNAVQVTGFWRVESSRRGFDP